MGQWVQGEELCSVISGCWCHLRGLSEKNDLFIAEEGPDASASVQNQPGISIPHNCAINYATLIMFLMAVFWHFIPSICIHACSVVRNASAVAMCEWSVKSGGGPKNGITLITNGHGLNMYANVCFTLARWVSLQNLACERQMRCFSLWAHLDCLAELNLTY